MGYMANEAETAKQGEMDGACGTRGNAYTILVEKPERQYHLEDLGTDGRIILKGRGTQIPGVRSPGLLN